MRIIFQTICVSILVLFAWLSRQPCTAELLFGGVAHSETVAPVPQQLMPGETIEPEQLEKLSPDNNWWPIPNWLAGTWAFDTETVTAIKAYVPKSFPEPPFTLHNEFTKVFGHQKDKTGQVWDYLTVPFNYTTKIGGGMLTYFVDSQLEVLASESDFCVRRLFGMDSVYDPKSHVIVLTQQKECINRLSSMGEGLLRIDSSTRIFDMKGEPVVDKSSNILGSLKKPFEPIDSLDGQDLKMKFAEYLRGHGKADLIP